MASFLWFHASTKAVLSNKFLKYCFWEHNLKLYIMYINIQQQFRKLHETWHKRGQFAVDLNNSRLRFVYKDLSLSAYPERLVSFSINHWFRAILNHLTLFRI